MSRPFLGNVHELSDLRDRGRVFRDRSHAGTVLAGMLKPYRLGGAIVLAIPAGGIPVGAVMAAQLGLSLDVAVVSKITLPWNTEAGYGAVAFDGTVRLNEEILAHAGLSEKQIREGINETLDKVKRRVKRLRGNNASPDVSQRPVILVDDGLASGSTMGVAVEAVLKVSVREVIVAVPTGHVDAVRNVAKEVRAVYCANIRGGWSFAVADAYRHWRDVDEAEAAEIYRRSGTGHSRPNSDIQRGGS